MAVLECFETCKKFTTYLHVCGSALGFFDHQMACAVDVSVGRCCSKSFGFKSFKCHLPRSCLPKAASHDTLGPLVLRTRESAPRTLKWAT